MVKKGSLYYPERNYQYNSTEAIKLILNIWAEFFDLLISKVLDRKKNTNIREIGDQSKRTSKLNNRILKVKPMNLFINC